MDILGFTRYQFPILNKIPSVRYKDTKKEFDETYGKSYYGHAIVVDVGADIGITPSLFKRRGADRVIAYSLDKQSIWYTDKNIEWMGEWHGELPDGGIFKIDCEGCEYILNSPEKIVGKYGEWYVAIHVLPELEHVRKFVEWYDFLSEKGNLVYHVGNEYMFHGGKNMSIVEGGRR